MKAKIVRNWWLDCYIDGRETKLTGGPKNKDGGFSLTIYQRSLGGIIKAGYLDGMVDNEGNLILHGKIGDDEVEFITQRP